MNTVFITANLGGTQGTAKSARDFLRALLGCCQDVTVISQEREKFPEELCGRKLAKPVWMRSPERLRFPRRPNRLWFQRFQAWRKSKADNSAFQRLGKQSKLVIINGWASYNYWQQMAPWVKVKTIMIVRESPRHFSFGDYGTKLEHLLKGFAEFDELLFVSQRVQKEWMDFAGLKGKPSHCVPNCCEQEEAVEMLLQSRASVRERIGLGRNDFIIICPGTIEGRKGQDLLLDIMPELNAAIPNLKVLFVGGADSKWGQDFLKRVANSLHVDQIICWNCRPTICDALYASDVLAFPSRAEAMPRTVLEAMALKIPVVASDVDGIPELIVNGRTGIIFKADDKEGLKDGLLKMAGSGQLRSEMALAGHDRYWHQFSRRHQMQRVGEFIANQA